MYIGEVKLASMIHFLTGFRIAALVMLAVDEEHRELYEQVVVEHGWKWTPKHFSWQMTKRGWSPEKSVDELLAIEIDFWRRVIAEKRQA
jgi:hypothetical protein